MESPVLVKGLLLLESLAARGGATLAELAAELDLPKPTVHRVLGDLVSLGYAARAEGGSYVPAAGAWRLVPGGRDRLLAAAEPALERLWRSTRETVNLGELSGTRVRYLRVLACPLPLRREIAAGSTDPALSTALGRVLAAELPPERRAALLSGRIPRRTARTETDPRRLAALLDDARAQGFAVEQDQTDVGVTCVAASVRDRGGVRAAISVSLPTARVAEHGLDRLADRVVRTAEAVSKRLRGSRRANRPIETAGAAR